MEVWNRKAHVNLSVCGGKGGVVLGDITLYLMGQLGTTQFSERMYNCVLSAEISCHSIKILSNFFKE